MNILKIMPTLTKMMTNNKALYILVFVLAVSVMASCGQRKKEAFSHLPFPEVNPPGMMTDAQDRADWLSVHYWDRVSISPFRLVDKFHSVCLSNAFHKAGKKKSLCILH